MSENIQHSENHESTLIKLAIKNIKNVMVNQATILQQSATTHPKTLVFTQSPPKQTISNLWIFKLENEESVTIQLIPQLVDLCGVTLKVSNQQMLVDLLKASTFYLTQWKIVVSESNQISFKLTDSATYFTKNLKEKIHKLKQQAINFLPRLFDILQLQYLEAAVSHHIQTKNHPNNHSIWQQIFLIFVIIQTKKILRLTLDEGDPKHYYKGGKEQKTRKQQIFKDIKAQREAALNQVAASIKLLREKQLFFNDFPHEKLKRSEANLQLWTKSTKNQWKSHPKNVFAVKILKENSNQPKLQTKASHCEVMKGRFQIIILTSFNTSTNQVLDNLPGAKKVAQNKQLELAKKICKNLETISSINSFKNEVDFIYYIKDRSCKYIATYYWNTQKKKSETKEIIMEFYPQTFEYAADPKRKIMTTKFRLKFFMQVANALSWLSDNQICHRDIKPANIMLDYNQIPKIVDFGSCCPSYQPGIKNAFQVTESRLLASQMYSLRHKKLPENIKIKYDRIQYDQHTLFDAYSLGRMMEEYFPQPFNKNLKAGRQLLSHLWRLCLEDIPEDRPTYDEIGYILHQMLLNFEKLHQSL